MGNSPTPISFRYELNQCNRFDVDVTLPDTPLMRRSYALDQCMSRFVLDGNDVLQSQSVLAYCDDSNEVMYNWFDGPNCNDLDLQGTAPISNLNSAEANFIGFCNFPLSCANAEITEHFDDVGSYCEGLDTNHQVNQYAVGVCNVYGGTGFVIQCSDHGALTKQYATTDCSGRSMLVSMISEDDPDKCTNVQEPFFLLNYCDS